MAVTREVWCETRWYIKIQWSSMFKLVCPFFSFSSRSVMSIILKRSSVVGSSLAFVLLSRMPCCACSSIHCMIIRIAIYQPILYISQSCRKENCWAMLVAWDIAGSNAHDGGACKWEKSKNALALKLKVQKATFVPICWGPSYHP